jgi:hypothetical protein
MIALFAGTGAFALDQNYEETVRSALDDFGYTTVAVSDLTEEQKVLVYTTATGENRNDTEAVLEQMDLEKASIVVFDPATLVVVTAADMTPDAFAYVNDELMDRGYSEGQIAELSDEQYVLLYSTITSEQSNDVTDVLDNIFDS